MINDPQLSSAVTLAVVQTTQTDHERRLTTLETNYGKIIFWAVGATVSSIVTLAAVVVDALTRHGL